MENVPTEAEEEDGTFVKTVSNFKSFVDIVVTIILWYNNIVI